jgi:hypothetical protein
MRHLQLLALPAALALSTTCGDSNGPNLHGPPFFRATVDGTQWTPTYVAAACIDFAFMLSAAPIPSGSDFLQLRVGDLAASGQFSLADSTSGRFALTYSLQAPSYVSTAQDPGRLTITAVDFTDSLVAGTFSVHLTSVTDPTAHLSVSASFRQPLQAIYTVQNPEGTPCHDAT